MGNDVIRVFDEQTHHAVEINSESSAHDRSTMGGASARPLVVVGGELTLDSLDLISLQPVACTSTKRRCISRPTAAFSWSTTSVTRTLSPDRLLNRFITPMEYQIDYFTLRTGQKIQLPCCATC